MTLKPYLALLAAVGLAPAMLPAQSASVFEGLHGRWFGEGTLMGREATFSMWWTATSRVANLTFSNAFVNPGGEPVPVLHAAATYLTSPDKPEGFWDDSRGVRITLRWVATDSTLTVTWTAPTETGRTTYTVRGSDSIVVTDEVERDGVLSTFATATYRRTAAVD